jgi:hypothetical protein
MKMTEHFQKTVMKLVFPMVWSDMVMVGPGTAVCVRAAPLP